MCQKGPVGAGKMTRRSRALTVFIEDPGLNLSIRKAAHRGLYVIPVPRNLTSSDLQDAQTYMQLKLPHS